jgi:hypothetical protein
MYKQTIDSPKVMAIAERVGKQPNFVLGALLRVWAWVDTHGNLDGADASFTATPAQLDRVGQCKGLAEAMASVGWLAVDGPRLVFPGWCERNTDHGKVREQAARRMRTIRARSSHSANGQAYTPDELRDDLVARNGHEHGADLLRATSANVALLEKRREEKRERREEAAADAAAGSAGAAAAAAAAGADRISSPRSATPADLAPPMRIGPLPVPPEDLPASHVPFPPPPPRARPGGGTFTPRDWVGERNAVISAWREHVSVAHGTKAPSVNDCRRLAVAMQDMSEELGIVRDGVLPWLLGHIRQYGASKEAKRFPCSLKTFLGDQPGYGKWREGPEQWDVVREFGEQPAASLAARSLEEVNARLAARGGGA